MSHEITITIKRGNLEYSILNSKRVHGRLKAWCKDLEDIKACYEDSNHEFGTEMLLVRSRVTALLRLIYESEIIYFDGYDHPTEWHSCFMLPFMQRDGWKVFITNS